MVVANITTKSSTQREKEKPTLGQRVRSDASSYVPLAQRQTKQSEVQTSNELQKINSSKNSGDEKPRVIPIPPISKRTVKPLSPVVKKGEEPSHHSAKECHAVTASQLANSTNLLKKKLSLSASFVKPAGESTVKPIAKPVTQPATKPVTKPATKPVTKPATKPVTQPATKPVTQPATKPVTQPVTKPVTKPAPQSVANADSTTGSKSYFKPRQIKVKPSKVPAGSAKKYIVCDQTRFYNQGKRDRGKNDCTSALQAAEESR